ncbi:MAG: helix-turn-helix transcriptional regulator, partial [Oscillibacter sp.]|nr:helix-turn-helix transcriptional regulator [Oscillibacter sp.]
MRIKEARMARGLSQKDFAAIVNIAPNTLSQYETGKREPDLKTLSKLADYFGVSVDYLLGRGERQPDNSKTPA